MPDPFQYGWIAWIVIAAVAVVLELVTVNLVFVMVAGGALIGGLGGGALGLPWELQIVLAAVVSALLLLTLRPPLLRRLARSSESVPMNIEALTGMAARASTVFTRGAGQAKLANGETWTARLDAEHETDAVAPGAELVVVAIDGATAVVTPETALSAEHPLWG